MASQEDSKKNMLEYYRGCTVRNMEELVKTSLSEVKTWFQLHTPTNMLQGFMRKGNLSFLLTVI